MRHGTLLCAIAKRVATLDVWIFAADDHDAAARGWQVDRSRRFIRTYRDPRWDLVAPEPVTQRGRPT